LSRSTTLGVGFALLALALLAGSASGSTTEAQAAVGRLSFLLGDWRGEGFDVLADGRRQAFQSFERVTSQLEGTALLIEVRHTEFQGLVVLTHDTDRSYRMRLVVVGGQEIPITATLVEERTFVWSPSPDKRYTIRVDRNGERWHEVGEATQDGGKTWRQIFEMTNLRQPEERTK
jgi:hypothetical protein